MRAMKCSNGWTAGWCETTLDPMMLLPFDVVFTRKAVDSNIVTFGCGVHTGSNLFNESEQYLVNSGCSALGRVAKRRNVIWILRIEG